MRILKKVSSFLLFVIMLLPLNVFAYDYEINGYDINIVVNENNTFNITEDISTQFNTYKHGIFRKIPLKNEVLRLDGSKSITRAKINDISVNENNEVYNENGHKVIKIGDANNTLIGKKEYSISYLYNLGKDSEKDYDEFYFNLIGPEWDTTISNVTFSIVMPKEFDEEKLGFSSGSVGSTLNDVSYEVVDNTIIGKLNTTLNPGEALTIRLELPEGYFVGASSNFDMMMVLAILLPIVFAICSFLLWRKYGKDDTVVETVEFYPPEGFNSLEIGFLYKGSADNKDVTSLLIYLANKGYIKISETKNKSLFSTTDGFKITKIKEYDGDNEKERLFLEGLFTRNTISAFFGKEKSDNYNEVTSSELQNNFYITMNKILANVNNRKNKNQIFEKAASGKKKYFILMIIVIFLLITVPPIINYGASENLIFALIFPGIGFTVLFNMVFNKTPWPIKLFGLVWGCGFGGIPWATMVLPTLLEEPIYLFIYIIGLICVGIICICLHYLPKRTAYGNEMLGKILGFKNFLETAEKEKLESMVFEDPTYFYDILPFTYVLGVSDKWISKFETIAIKQPDWYDSPTAFDVITFNTFINNTMSSAQIAMSSSPSSSSSGGSSGGGFSGGGSGGGGGGSW